MADFKKIGATQAIEALDQAASFESREYAIDSYCTNLGDTLNEMGATQEQATEAVRGFERALADRGISYRVAGF